MFGKRHLAGSRQDVLLLTANGDTVERCIDALPDCIIDYKNTMAWDLDYNQQYIDEYSGKSFQVVSEKDYRPIRIYKGRVEHKTDSFDDLFFRKIKESLSLINERKRKNNTMLWLGIVLTLFAITISAMVLMSLNKSDMPQILSMVTSCLI